MTKKNVKRILFVVLAIVCISLTFHINSALAEDWVNPMQGPDWCPSCVPMHYDDMGSFDAAGLWSFSWPTTAPDGLPLPDICNDWGPANPCADEEYWTPTIGIQNNESRLTYRNYPDQPAYTEIAINAGMSIRYPEVWMMPPGAEHNDEWSWVAGFMPPDGADWNNEYLQDWNKCIEEWPHYATFPPEQDNCGNVNNMGEPMAPQFCYHDAGGTPMCDPGPAETHCSTLSAVYNCLTVHETNPEFGFLGPLCSSMGPEQAFWDSFNPVMNADNDVNVGCKEQRRVYMLTDNLEPLTNDRVASVVWDGHGVMDYKHCVTDTFFEYIDYDMESRMWEHIRFSPQSKSNYGPEFRYTSPDAPVVGMNKIIVTYDTNQTLEINVDVDNVDPMPIVDSKTKYVAQKDDKSKSGKAVKVLENQVVKNITTRFLDNGALVIQWPEPDGALMGGMQLRLFIGNDTINPVTGCNDEDFLWINSPAQIGTIVITSDIWEPFVLKTLGRDPEATSIVAVFMYRDTYNQDGGVAYHNRGYSGEFYIPLTP